MPQGRGRRSSGKLRSTRDRARARSTELASWLKGVTSAVIAPARLVGRKHGDYRYCNARKMQAVYAPNGRKTDSSRRPWRGQRGGRPEHEVANQRGLQLGSCRRIDEDERGQRRKGRRLLPMSPVINGIGCGCSRLGSRSFSLTSRAFAGDAGAPPSVDAQRASSPTPASPFQRLPFQRLLFQRAAVSSLLCRPPRGIR